MFDKCVIGVGRHIGTFNDVTAGNDISVGNQLIENIAKSQPHQLLQGDIVAPHIYSKYHMAL